MEIKAVIFDMDGVIVNSEPFWAEAEHTVFSGKGAVLSPEFKAVTRLMTTREAVQFWHEKFPWENPDFEAVEREVIAHVGACIGREDCSTPGIKEFVQMLKDSGLFLALATNAPRAIVPAALSKAEVEGAFTVIVTADDVSKGKPDPEIYLKAAALLNIAPEHCLVIEDSDYGMEAAKLAGMQVVAFSPDYRQFSQADYHLRSFQPPFLFEGSLPEEIFEFSGRDIRPKHVF
jgi:HAD superfamily hydrolase (TIGR01509 family)